MSYIRKCFKEILDDPILDDNTLVLQPAPKFIATIMQKFKDFGNLFLDYIPPKLKVVHEALESFKKLIKKLYNRRDTSFQLKESKSIRWKRCLISIYFWLTPSSLLQTF